MNQIESKLESHGLRKTSQRIEILSIISASETAISQNDITKSCEEKMDRVTIYRVIKSLESNGLIHRIIDGENGALFAACKHKCTEHGHIDSHFHFKCTSCEKIWCLEDQKEPTINIPKGYQAESIKLTIEGKCDSCIN